MRKQSTQHSEVNHEDKLKVEDKSICEDVQK